jgi:hypothetical protein
MNKVLQSLRVLESTLRGSKYWDYYTENYLKDVYKILDSETSSVEELQQVIVLFLETRFLPILEQITSRDEERKMKYQELSFGLSKESERVRKLGDHYKSQLEKIDQYDIIEKDLVIVQRKVVDLTRELERKSSRIKELEQQLAAMQHESAPTQVTGWAPKGSESCMPDLDINIIDGPTVPGIGSFGRF